MKILHVDLQERGSNSVEFRFFWDNPNQTRPYTRSLSEIDNLSGRADTDYYTRLPEDYIQQNRTRLVPVVGWHGAHPPERVR